MTFDQVSNNTNFLKPVFIDKSRQQAYDAANPNAEDTTVASAMPDINLPSESQSSNTGNDALKFSSLLSGFGQKSFKLPTYNPSQALKNNNYPNQNSNSTPPISGKLNTAFNKIGAITTEWGDSTRYEKFHPGIDIANKVGTPIPAFVGGTVTSVDTGHQHGEKGYGNTITVTDANGDKHRYSHLHQVFVKVGQKIGQGQELATMGDSGSTYSPSGKGTGAHLDYRIVDAYNKYVNPNSYLQKLT